MIYERSCHENASRCYFITYIVDQSFAVAVRDDVKLETVGAVTVQRDMTLEFLKYKIEDFECQIVELET